MLTPVQIDRIFYHHPCVDGTMGYTIAREYYEKIGKTVKYEPCGIGRIDVNDIKDENILFIDITVKYDIMKKLILNNNNILVLDHHKTSMEDLKELPDQNKIFDIKKSGASIAWDYFHPTEDSPLVVKYVEDRDIWNKKLENNELFYSWFYKLPATYEEYIKYFDNNLLSDAIGLNNNKENIKANNYKEVDDYYINEEIKWTTVPQFISIGTNYYFIANTNSSILKSEIGNQLFKQYPLIDFSAVTNNNLNNTHMSLRSIPTAADVGEIAKFYGSGGHMEASGIKFPFLISHLGNLLDNGITYKYLNDIYIEEDIVYMYSPINKVELSKYLLQKRRKDGQYNCIDILNKLKKDISKITDIKLSVVWDYNPIKDKTYMTIKCNEILSKLEREELMILYNLDFDNKIELTGIHKILNINTYKYLNNK